MTPPSPKASSASSLRHGLDATGTVGAQTLKALNVPVGDRIKQLEASLERLLGMDFIFAERYVVVNIPAAFVEAVANGKVERRYRVIVGKIDKPSPTLSAYITAIDLNPTWTVPLSITKTEIAAHMRRDPSYLARMHMRLIGAHDEISIRRASIGRAIARRISPCGRTPATGTRSAISRSTCRTRIRSICTTPTRESCSPPIIASTRTAAPGSTMCATLPPGSCRTARRAGIAHIVDPGAAVRIEAVVGAEKLPRVGIVHINRIRMSALSIFRRPGPRRPRRRRRSTTDAPVVRGDGAGRGGALAASRRPARTTLGADESTRHGHLTDRGRFPPPAPRQSMILCTSACATPVSAPNVSRPAPSPEVAATGENPRRQPPIHATRGHGTTSSGVVPTLTPACACPRTPGRCRRGRTRW